MQGYFRKKPDEQEFAGGEFCEVVSTLTHDLTKARNQLARLMHQVKPGGARLYGGYYGPHSPGLRAHTPCAGSNVRNRQCTPASGLFGCGKEIPHHKSASPQPQKPCRPMTVHGAKHFGQPEQRAPFAKQKLKRPQQRVPYSCERSQEKLQYSCEKPQQCNRSDMSDRSDNSDRRDMSGQSDSTCINITFESPKESPEPPPQRCRRTSNTFRDSKTACLKCSCDLPRLQGGGGRHDCVGTQFAAQLKDVTFQLRERRLAANLVKRC